MLPFFVPPPHSFPLQSSVFADKEMGKDARETPGVSGGDKKAGGERGKKRAGEGQFRAVIGQKAFLGSQGDNSPGLGEQLLAIFFPPPN